MPTHDQLAPILTELEQALAQVKGASCLTSEGDQDYYTRKTLELLSGSGELIEEALGYLRMTQAGLPMEQRTAGHRAMAGRQDPTTTTTVRPPARRNRPFRTR